MVRDTSKLVTIPGELHSAATGNIVAAAEEVFDYTTNKYQNDINQEVAYIKEDSSVAPIPSFNPQSQTVHLDEQVLSNAQKKQVRKNIGLGNGDIDSTPTAESDNVVRSGGVYASMQELRSTVNPQVGYYTCYTAGNTAAKVIDASGYTLLKGGGLRVNFTEKNTAANATLNIEQTGAKPLYYNGVRVSTNNSWYAGEIMTLFYDGSAFQLNSLPDLDEYDVSARNGGQAFTFEEAVALVPEAYRHGGLKLRFISNSDSSVQSSDNKYVQWRLMDDTFNTTPSNWQGVDNEPTVDSDNLVKSGGVLSQSICNTLINNYSAVSTSAYIDINIDIKKDNYYKLMFTRSLAWNALEIATWKNEAYIQTVFSNTFVVANQKYEVIFRATDDASRIVFKDTRNDSAIYNISLYVKEVNIEENNARFEENNVKFNDIDIDLSEIYVGEKESYKYTDKKYQIVKKVAYVANNDYPTLIDSNDRCSVSDVLQPIIDSFITLNCGENYNWSVQSKSQDGAQDTGWMESGARARVLYHDVRITFRTSSNHPNGQNADITDTDLEYLSNILINSSLLKSWKILNNQRELDDKTWGIEFKRNIVSRYPCPLIRHATRTYTKFSPNTKEGSVIAALQGMKIIENDIRRTSDGVYVLNHENDMSINFVYANGDAIPADTEYISEHTYQELIDDFKLNMYGGYSKICTLIEQLNICRQYNIGLFAEIKDFTNVSYVIEVIELCKKYLKYENFVLLVGDITLHQSIRNFDSHVVICECDVYWWRLPDLNIIAQYNGNSFIGVNWDDVMGEHGSSVEEYITKAHNLGIPVAAWTVEGVDVSRIKQRGDICAITTNYAIDNISGNIVYEYCSMSDGIENIENLQFNNVSRDIHTKGLIVQDGGSITFTQEQVEGAGNIILDIDVDGKLSLSTNTPISGLYNNIIENGGFRIGFAEGFYTNNAGNRIYTLTAVGEAKINILKITQTKVI